MSYLVSAYWISHRQSNVHVSILCSSQYLRRIHPDRASSIFSHFWIIRSITMNKFTIRFVLLLVLVGYVFMMEPEINHTVKPILIDRLSKRGDGTVHNRRYCSTNEDGIVECNNTPECSYDSEGNYSCVGKKWRWNIGKNHALCSVIVVNIKSNVVFVFTWIKIVFRLVDDEYSLLSQRNFFVYTVRRRIERR